MLAAHNVTFGNIAQELYKANTDERIRQECEAREEFYFQQRRQQERWEEKLAELEKVKTEQRRQQEKMKEAKAEQRKQKREITDLKKDILVKDQTISSLEAEVARLQKELENSEPNE